MQDCWNAVGVVDIVEKMIRCCAKLEEWGGGLLKEMKVRMDYCRRELKNLRSRRDAGGIQNYNIARWEFLCLLEKQEIFWKQRENQFWLQEGDKNSHIFS